MPSPPTGPRVPTTARAAPVGAPGAAPPEDLARPHRAGRKPKTPPAASLREMVERGLSDDAIAEARGVTVRTVRNWRIALGIGRAAAKRIRLPIAGHRPPRQRPPIGFDLGAWPPSLETLMELVQTDRTDLEIGELYGQGATAIRQLRLSYLDRAGDDQEVEFCLRRLFRRKATKKPAADAIRALCRDQSDEAELYRGFRYGDVNRRALLAETFVPGWAWECPTPNIAERHDPKAVRPKAARVA